MTEIDRTCHTYPWNEKLNSAFWIGTPNGAHLGNDVLWKTNHRSQLVLYSLAHPDLLWARFTPIKNQDHVCTEMKRYNDFLCSNRIPEVDSCKYKYLMDVDGWASSFYRAQWILRAGCVLIKENSNHIQWYFSRLRPYVHYIPYQADCSDLSTIIRNLRIQDEQAHQIALNGRDFSLKYLNPNITHYYLYYVLKEYAQLGIQ